MNTKHSLSLLLLLLATFFINIVKGLNTEGIHYGFAAPEDEFTFQVSVDVKEDRYNIHQSICGGALVGEYFVLLAAHCFTNEMGDFYIRWYEVRAGVKDLKSRTGIVVQVAAIYAHPHFDATKNRNDIGLIKLKTYVKVGANSSLSMLNLPEPNLQPDGKIGKLAGWGYNYIELRSDPPNVRARMYGESDYVLRYIHVKILNETECADWFERVPKSEFCGHAISERSNELWAASVGDGGSVLAIENVAVGILNTVSFDLHRNDYPAKYTKVYIYLDFIRKIMNGITPRHAFTRTFKDFLRLRAAATS